MTSECMMPIKTVSNDTDCFVVVTLMTHIFPMYFLFPELNKMTIFGFPADYWLTIVIGWLVLIPVF